MRKYLLPENGNFYKANLHCHSTVSDGHRTPEELKEAYMKMGYSVIAYTDHNILIAHDELTDASFLALHGYEIDVCDDFSKSFEDIKTCHFCLIALDKDNLFQPMWNENLLFQNAPKHAHLVKTDRTLPPYERIYDGAHISEMMKIGRESGFFVTYNHPTWSLESYPEYISYDGMHAMEMFNGSCAHGGFEEYNPRVYNDMLNAGKRIYCIGADDNHNYWPFDHSGSDSGRAFTVIKADRLEYNAVTDALLKGNFYCSTGPEITALWAEDGKIHIECSAAKRVFCVYKRRKCCAVIEENGTPVTSTDFSFTADDGWVRITVYGCDGGIACTNAYFID